MDPLRPIFWDDEAGCPVYIDQTFLPGEFVLVRCRTVEQLMRAISRLGIRGAPALGVAGAFGVALAAREAEGPDFPAFQEDLERLALLVAKTRPTAVNLSWGVFQVLDAIRSAKNREEACRLSLKGALLVMEADRQTCHRIGDHGQVLLEDGMTVLTHCNAGALACAEWGTALGVIRSAVQAGKTIHVIACETRPLLQGARLTAFELHRDGIPVRVVPDSAAAYLMQKGEVGCVITGADRITRDAVFNKIGTYMHAVSAHHHQVPFYVAAPLSTFDFGHRGQEITVEERGRDEVALLGDRIVVPPDVPVINYAFDATPMDLITALITEDGVCRAGQEIETLFRVKS